MSPTRGGHAPLNPFSRHTVLCLVALGMIRYFMQYSTGAGNSVAQCSQPLYKASQGQYVGVEGYYEARHYNLISACVPQQCFQSTLQTLHRLLLALPQGIKLTWGDFNAGPDPILDASKLP